MLTGVHTYDARILIQSDVESAWLEARPPLDVAQPRAVDEKGRRRASAQSMAISRSDELGLVDGDGINDGGAGEEKIEGPSAALFLPMARRCKRVDVDVGLCHQKERQACLFGSGTRRGRPVARGSVCQMQVVSNHRSGVAARKHPFWQGSRVGSCQVPPGHPDLSVQSLSGGGQIAQSAYTRRLRPTWIRPEAAPSRCLCDCVPAYLRTSLRLQVR